MTMGLKIALDYDGTYTEDTYLWDEFMKHAKSRGHEVILTSSREKADLSKDVNLQNIAKIAAGLILGDKKKVKDNHGFDFDIYIDNGRVDNGRDTPTKVPEVIGGVKEDGVVGQTPEGGSGVVEGGEADTRVTEEPTPKPRGRRPRVPK